MGSPVAAPLTVRELGWGYWLRVVAVTIAGSAVFGGVAIAGRRLGWPHPGPIGFGAGIFTNTVLLPAPGGVYRRSLAWRAAFGVVLGCVAGVLLAFMLKW